MSERPGTHRKWAVSVAFCVAAASCSGDGDSATSVGSDAPVDNTTIPATTTTEPPTTTAAAIESTTTVPDVGPASPVGLRSVEPFAEYRWVPALDDGDVYAGPATPTSLAEVLLVPSQEQLLNDLGITVPSGRDQLEANGFVVRETGYRFFHDGYKSAAYEYQPLYVTTDALYHSWHLVFDKVLRDTEQQRLLPTLEGLLSDAVGAAREQEALLAETALADDAHRATAYYEAAASMLGLDVGPVNDLAAEEIAMIDDAAGMQTSPITGVIECQAPSSFVGCVDASLFRPRGHYTRTPDLERYFRAMSVLGQEGFALDGGIAVAPALLVTRVLLTDPRQLDRWTAIYEPTAFLVGLADDIDPLQLAQAADAVLPGWRDDPELLVGADRSAIAEEVIAAHPVSIDPERAGVRLMGARFTLDSFILDQLAWPNVGEEPPDQRRVLVSALDLAAAFGSRLARERQLATESTFTHYEEQLDSMTDLVASRQPADWAGTVYDAWLAAIAPQYQTRGAAYPDYMQGNAWEAKSLQTGLSSYTELKHDTVLYTKQGSAGEGEGPEPGEFEPRHWVEPDPVSFGRLAAAAELLRTGFLERDLLTPETDDLLATLIELGDWLSGIAGRELDGVVADDADNLRLSGIGSELEYLWIVSSEIELTEVGLPVPDYDERAGLVTDVFTTSFEYLQLGTGDIDTIYVIVPLGDGRFELAVGQTASYYEFWRSSSEPRLTDEEWRMLLAQGEIPERPQWTEPFLVSAHIADGPIVRL